jgi:hypothetical protein
VAQHAYAREQSCSHPREARESAALAASYDPPRHARPGAAMDFIVKVAKPASGGSIVEGYYLPPAALDNPKDPFFHDPHQLTPLGFKRSGLQRTERGRARAAAEASKRAAARAAGSAVARAAA